MIEAKQVSLRIGGADILRSVSIGLSPGRVTAILGPNGSGKTTLLKCLTGALRPSEGTVYIDEREVESYSLTDLARRRAVLSQSYAITFPFTALEVVAMGRYPFGDPPTTSEEDPAIRTAMTRADVWHHRGRIFPTLSGGEQQRVQLARTLAQINDNDDGYLFLDEPTSALDLKHQHEVLGIVRDLTRDRRMTTCIILHDLNLARRYADDAVLLKKGRLVISGGIRSVLKPGSISDVFDIPEALAKDLLPVSDAVSQAAS